MTLEKELQWALATKDLCQQAIWTLEKAERALSRSGKLIYDDDIDRQLSFIILNLKSFTEAINKKQSHAVFCRELCKNNGGKLRQETV